MERKRVTDDPAWPVGIPPDLVAKLPELGEESGGPRESGRTSL
ncbi:MAG: hypothetical protein ACKOGA_02715 [Planctomycetaceae bacterium]